MLLKALQPYIPSIHDNDHLGVKLGDMVQIKSSQSELVSGFNQTTGKTGLVPSKCFLPEYVGLDFGTFSLKVWDPKNQFQNKPTRVKIGQGGSLKGLKRLVHKPETNPTPYLVENVQINFENDNLKLLGQDTVLDAKDLIKSLIEDICPNRPIVYSIPYLWSIKNSILLRQAALEAGSLEVNFIYQNESIILKYLKDFGEEKGCFLVVSIGASFTDVSIFEFKNQIKTLHKSSDYFGGYNFTHELYKYVLDQANLRNISDLESKVLFSECEMAKISLSQTNSAKIPLPNGNEFILLKSQLDKILLPFSRKLDEMIEACLSLSKIDENPLKKVLFYGNSFNLFKNHIKFPEENVTILNNDTIVIGSSIYHSLENRISFIDSRYYHYGIRISNDTVYPVVLNTETFGKECNFIVDRPGFATIQIYEGLYQLFNENTLLGNIQLDNIRFLQNTVFKIKFENHRQILKVSIYDGESLIFTKIFNELSSFICYPCFHPDSLIIHSKTDKSIGIEYARLEILNQNEFYILLNSSLNYSKNIRFRFFGEKVMTSTYSHIFHIFHYWNLINRLPIPSEHEKLTNEFKKEFRNLRFKDSIPKLNQDMEIYKIAQKIKNRYLEIHSPNNMMIVNLQYYWIFYEFLEEFTNKDPSDFKPQGQDYDHFIYHILKELKYTDLERFPTELKSIIELKLTKIMKTLEILSKPIPLVDLDTDRGLIPVEKVSHQMIKSIHEEIRELTSQHKNILNTPLILEDGVIKPLLNKQLFMYEENILKLLLKLDNISTHEQDTLRIMRKSVINYAQNHLEQLDHIKKLYTFN